MKLQEIADKTIARLVEDIGVLDSFENVTSKSGDIVGSVKLEQHHCSFLVKGNARFNIQQLLETAALTLSKAIKKDITDKSQLIVRPLVVYQEPGAPCQIVRNASGWSVRVTVCYNGKLQGDLFILDLLYGVR